MRNKLEAQDVKCIFLRYSFRKKGYKYYDTITKKILFLKMWNL